MAVSKKEKMKYLHFAVFVTIPFVFKLIPPVSTITPYGMEILGILLALLYGWITIGLLWPSLFGIVFLGLTEHWTMSSAVAGGLANSTVILCIFSYLFAIIIVKCGIANLLASWFLTRRIFRKNPWFLVIGLFLSASLAALLTMNTIAIMIIFGNVIAEIAKFSGYADDSKEITYLQLSIIPVLITICNCFPFMVGVIWMGWFRGAGYVMADSEYFISVLIQWAIATIMVIASLKVVFRCNYKKLRLSDDLVKQLRDNIKVGRDEKIGIAVIIAAFFILFGGVFLGGKVGFFDWCNKIGLIGVTIILGAILTNIRSERSGQPLYTFEEGFHGVNWSIVWLLGVSFPVASALSSAEAGVTDAVMGAVTPLLGGFSPTVFIIISFLLLGVLTQFCHNVVLAIMFVGLLSDICVNLGGNPNLLFLCVYFALNHASFATPAASMASGQMFANGHTSAAAGYKFGITYMLITFISILIFMPIYSLLF